MNERLVTAIYDGGRNTLVSYRTRLCECLPDNLVKKIRTIGRVRFTDNVVILFTDGNSMTVKENALCDSETLARIALEAP